MLDLAATVPNLSGIELVGNWHINDQNIDQMKAAVQQRGLRICMLTPDLWTQAKWGRGSLAAPDAQTRRAAVHEVQKVMDWAAASTHAQKPAGREGAPSAWTELGPPDRMTAAGATPWMRSWEGGGACVVRVAGARGGRPIGGTPCANRRGRAAPPIPAVAARPRPRRARRESESASRIRRRPPRPRAAAAAIARRPPSSLPPPLTSSASPGSSTE
jgi:hypothetical protein